MKFRVTLLDGIDLLVDADKEIEAVRKAKIVRDAVGAYVKDREVVHRDSYEAVLKQLSPTNRAVFEKIVSESEMLSPSDVGVSKYRETMSKLDRFAKTLDISLLKDVARVFKGVTGGYYKFDDITI